MKIKATLTRAELLQALRYRHSAIDGDTTACGLLAEYQSGSESITLTAGCECGWPACEAPVNCPDCLAVQGKLTVN